MDIFIARQPVFDKNIEVVAYELLYRSSNNNVARSDCDGATSSVIINGLLMIGLQKLTDGKRAFVKFTRQLILDEAPTLFLSNTMAVEILEEFESDPLLIKAIKRLKIENYTIVLDEYVEKHTFGDTLTIADIIKVDFQLSDEATVTRIAQCYRDTKIQLFAEKVETQEQFILAKKLGYTYFQGYFFAKPSIMVSKDIPSFKTSHVSLFNELSSSEPDFTKISVVIENDLGVSYKILKLVNSGVYNGANNITSIKQALVRLGMKELSKWVVLLMLRDVGEKKPAELVRSSMIRGKALEILADKVNLGNRKDEFFILGILSMIDVIMDQSMEVILEELPLNEELKLALMGKNNFLRKVLEIIIAYERADWDEIEQIGYFGSGMTDEMLFDSYFEAIRWTQKLYGL